MSYFGLNPRVRRSGLGLAQYGRIGASMVAATRGLLVEAAWAASKAPRPLRALVLGIRARRGHQVAAVATARKLTVLIWQLLAKDQDYLWTRPALVAAKQRQLALKAGAAPMDVGKRWLAYAYHVKELRDSERAAAEQAERIYDHLIRNWQPRKPGERMGAPWSSAASDA